MIGMEASGLFGNALTDALNKQNMSLRDLIQEIEKRGDTVTYEHLRKLIKGTAYPGKHMLSLISKVLKLDLPKMEQLVMMDQLEHKHGKNLNAVMHRDPQSVSFDELTRLLTPEQATMFKAQMRAVINSARKAAN